VQLGELEVGSASDPDYPEDLAAGAMALVEESLDRRYRSTARCRSAPAAECHDLEVEVADPVVQREVGLDSAPDSICWMALR